MILRFTASPDFDFITQFAEQIKMPIQNNFLEIPKSIGEGYVRKIAFDEDFRLLIHQYTLKENFIIKRNQTRGTSNLLSIFFYNNTHLLEMKYNEDGNIPFSQNSNSAVQVTTSDLI